MSNQLPDFREIPALSYSWLLREIVGPIEVKQSTIDFGINLHSFILEGRWGAGEPVVGEKKAIIEMARSLRAHGFNPKFFPERELARVWMRKYEDAPTPFILRCKAKFDAFRKAGVIIDDGKPSRGVIVDIKTTSARDIDEVLTNMREHWYWMQAFWYLSSMPARKKEIAAGLTVDDLTDPLYEMVFYFVQKRAPYRTFEVRCDMKTEEVIAAGEIALKTIDRLAERPDFQQFILPL